MSAVKPLEVNLTGLEGSVREGTAVVVYCVARGARPAATISWLNDSSALDKNAVETTLLQVITIRSLFISLLSTQLQRGMCEFAGLRFGDIYGSLSTTTSQQPFLFYLA